MSKKSFSSDDTFPINETGFPYNPRFSTSTTPLPTMRPLVNKQPTIPIYDYGKLYIPGEGKICAHKYFPEKFKEIMKQRIIEEKQKEAQLQMRGQAPQQQGGDDDEE